MIPTRRLVLATGCSCSPGDREKSKPKFGLICPARATLTIRKWPTLPAGSWPSWNRKRRHETVERQTFATLCHRFLCAALFHLAVALLVWRDPGLFVSLPAPGCPTLVGDNHRRFALAGHQSHDGPDG